MVPIHSPSSTSAIEICSSDDKVRQTAFTSNNVFGPSASPLISYDLMHIKTIIITLLDYFSMSYYYTIKILIGDSSHKNNNNNSNNK